MILAGLISGQFGSPYLPAGAGKFLKALLALSGYIRYQASWAWISASYFVLSHSFCSPSALAQRTGMTRKPPSGVIVR